MLFSDAKISVARVAGDQGDEDAREIAGDALKAAIRDWNTDNNWEFKFMEEPAIVLAAGETDITLPGIKKIHTFRSTDPEVGTLTFKRLRTLHWTQRDMSQTGTPIIYTVIEQGDQPIIRVFPTPTVDTTFYIAYFAEIAEPEDGEDIIDVPNRYLNGLLSRAKYLYLIDKDTENARLSVYEALSERLLKRAVRDDKKQPDENEQFISRAEWGNAFVSQDELDLI